MDILGPITTTPDGYKYILVLIDSFSKWCELVPLKKQEAPTIACALYDTIFTRYGSLQQLVSDSGKNFLAKVVKVFCQLFEVNRLYTSPYHPHSSATCEQQNSFYRH